MEKSNENSDNSDSNDENSDNSSTELDNGKNGNIEILVFYMYVNKLVLLNSRIG